MIQHRIYETYEDYVWNQGAKARHSREDLIARRGAKSEYFTRVFEQAKPYLHQGRPVLCLGARTGAEIIGAERAGFTGSTGIDLHPLAENVQQGDWHAMTFGDASFANVYSNSLDHCLSLDRLIAEIRRVLTADGVFYLMASDRETNKTVDSWLAKPNTEALYWQCANDLAKSIVGYGFKCKRTWTQAAWSHFILRRIP